MYNLIEYGKKYSKTSGTLWNYTRDISVDPITNSESFRYKTSITGKTANDRNTKEVEFSVPLKHLSNFWKALDIPLINFEVSLTLTWSKNYVITDETTRDADANAYPPMLEIRAPIGAAFKITDTKLYVPVVTLSTDDENKLLEQLKTGFKRIIKWNKYRSEMSNQTKNNNLNYLIDPIFNKVNRLFIFSFENEDDKTSFSKYYTRKETYQKIIEMSKNNDYTTGNLLDYDYFSNHCKLIATDLTKQIELENSDLKQQINFIGKLKEDDGATMFFIIERSEERTFEFSQN